VRVRVICGGLGACRGLCLAGSVFQGKTDGVGELCQKKCVRQACIGEGDRGHRQNFQIEG
jgi:hypothetical protein